MSWSSHENQVAMSKGVFGRAPPEGLLWRLPEDIFINTVTIVLVSIICDKTKLVTTYQIEYCHMYGDLAHMTWRRT